MVKKKKQQTALVAVETAHGKFKEDLLKEGLPPEISPDGDEDDYAQEMMEMT